MNKFYRFDSSGRYQGWIAQDRPIEQYADRLGVDLCLEAPPQAPAGHFARRVAGAWQLAQEAPAPHLSLEMARARKWSAMKSARKTAIETPLATPYGTFDADTEARHNIVQTAQLMQTAAQSLAPGSQPTTDFTLFDNSVVTLTAAQMVEVALLLADQINAAYARGRQVRAQIDAATTVEEVGAVAW